jgi:hypothetical protein
MPTLRAIRLLNAVEAGTHNAAQLQTSLSDPGRLVDFKVLLSMRGQARRMAASDITITAIANSQLARDAVFKEASVSNSITNQAILANATAVGIVSTNLDSLTQIEANSVTWNQWIASLYYENNSLNIIKTFAGTQSFPSIQALIANGTANNLVSGSRPAMRALVASPSATTAMAASGGMMNDVAANSTSMGIIAASGPAMAIVAASVIAMGTITPVADAVSLVANSTVGINAVYANDTAWTAFKASPSFAANLVAVISKLAGIAATFASVDAIIANAAALTLVNASAGASNALTTNSSALATLSASSNFSIIGSNAPVLAALAGNSTALVNLAGNSNFVFVAGNSAVMAAFAANSAAVTALGNNAANFAIATNTPVAIGALTGNQAAMTNYIGNNTTLAALFGSSSARGAMFASNIVVNTIATTASALTWLKVTSGLKKETYSTVVPNTAGRVGLFEAFGGGVTSKVLVLAVRQAGIAAIPTNYQLATGAAGTVAGTAFDTIGVAALAADQYPQAHIATYSNLSVKTAAAVIAISGVLGIQYIEMT